DPGGDEAVHPDVEGEHIHPAGLGPHHERRPARPAGVPGPLLADEAGRGELGGERHDRAAVEAHAVAEFRPGHGAVEMHVPQEGAEITLANLLLGSAGLQHSAACGAIIGCREGRTDSRMRMPETRDATDTLREYQPGF